MNVYYRDSAATLLLGDARKVLQELPAGSADCVVTSPPYFGLRDYQLAGQYGLEATPQEYVDNLRAVFREVRRVLAADGTLWLNLGDCYSGGARTSYDTVGGKTGGRGIAASRPVGELPGKNMLGIPWRVVFGLQEDGWILRDAIIWHKPNAMPESVRDRLSCRYETIFLLVRQQRHWFSVDAIRDMREAGVTGNGRHCRGRPGAASHSGDRLSAAPGRRCGNGMHERMAAACRGKGRWSPALITVSGHAADPDGLNPGAVWRLPTRPFRAAHFAVFPIDIPLRCIRAGCRAGGTVLDPFSGAATTGLAALQLGRRYIGIDVNPGYHGIAVARLQRPAGRPQARPARPEAHHR